jgi:cytochrome c biogenesis protein CcdA
MNIKSLAKAIGIVLGAATVFISFLVLMAMSKTFTVILFISAIVALVIAILWSWIMIIYHNIEDKKKGYWDN